MRKLRFYLLFVFFIFFPILVHAYTYENVGYQNNNSEVYALTNYLPSPVNLPRTDNSKYFTGGNSEYLNGLLILTDQLNLDSSYVYQFEVSTPGTIFSLANTADVVYGTANNTTGSCNVLSTLYTNEYPQITFKCNTGGANITELSVTFRNSSNTAIISGGTNLWWNYVFMRRQIDDTSSNTQDIINNQNQNTQDIQNTINENLQTCHISSNLFNPTNVVQGYINDSTGALSGISNSGNVSTDYIEINSNTKYYILASKSSGNWGAFYDSSKTFISGITSSNWTNQGKVVTSPNNAKYIRFTASYNGNNTNYANNVMITQSSSAISFEAFGANICVNKIDETNNAINGLNESLNDDDTDEATDEASDFFESFSTDTFGLTSIITAPLSLIQSITSSTCSSLELPLPYLDNKKLILPCMSTIYSTYFGAFFTIYQTITYGIIAYWVCVRIFNQVKDFKNPEHDEIEVVDL